MLWSDIKAIPRCFLFKNNVDISSLGGLDSFGSQQTRHMVLALLFLIFVKLIAQPPLVLYSLLWLKLPSVCKEWRGQSCFHSCSEIYSKANSILKSI